MISPEYLPLIIFLMFFVTLGIGIFMTVRMIRKIRNKQNEPLS